MINRKQLLEHAKSQHATDIHICAGAPILFRLGGKLVPITKEKLTTEQSSEISLDLLTEDQKKQLEKYLDFDLMLAEGTGRYRINVGYFNGAIGVGIFIFLYPCGGSNRESDTLPVLISLHSEEKEPSRAASFIGDPKSVAIQM